MNQDTYNDIQNLLKKGSIIKSVEFYNDGSFMCRTTIPEFPTVAFSNLMELLEFQDEHSS